MPGGIYSPPNGSQLPGPEVTFIWAAGHGVTHHRLQVGTSAGGADLYNGPVQPANKDLFATVANIPEYGTYIGEQGGGGSEAGASPTTAIYARLWAKNNQGAWFHTDTHYIAPAVGSGRVGPPGPAGAPGAKGDKGDKGDPGSGGGMHEVTDAAYTLLASDAGKLVMFLNTGAVAVTIPKAADMPQNFMCWIQNYGSPTVTLTPTDCVIDTAASLVLEAQKGVGLFSDNANWWTERGMGSAGGGLPSRETITFSTGTLANGATETGTVVIRKSYEILMAHLDRYGRLRFYSTAAKRDADLTRIPTTPPPYGKQHGVVFDLRLTSNTGLDWDCSPNAGGSNKEVVVSKEIPYAITNQSGASAAVAVSLDVLPKEAD